LWDLAAAKRTAVASHFARGLLGFFVSQEHTGIVQDGAQVKSKHEEAQVRAGRKWFLVFIGSSFSAHPGILCVTIEFLLAFFFFALAFRNILPLGFCFFL
jgi:hypothetical protein